MMNEEEEVEIYVLSLIGQLEDNNKLKQKSWFVRRSGTLISIQSILFFMCFSLLGFGIVNRPHLLYYFFYAGIYIFSISSILTIILLFNSKNYLNPMKVKRIRTELESMEFLKKKRNCFFCHNELNFLDYSLMNIKFSMDELINIWKNEIVEIFCCSCYNKRNSLILKYNIHIYLLGLIFSLALLIGIGIIYRLEFIVNIGLIGILVVIVITIIFSFIESRKRDYGDKIKIYLFIGILLLVFLNILFLNVSIINIKGIEFEIYILTLLIYLIITIPSTIIYIHKKNYRKKELKHMTTLFYLP